MRRTLAAAALGVLLAVSAAAPARAGDMQTLQVARQMREYYLHVPEGVSGTNAPLLIVLHGAGGNGRQAVRRYGWEKKADAERFVVAGPDAWRRQPDKPADFRSNPRFWNDAARRGASGVPDSDDIGLIVALIDTLAHQHGIDRRRVYVTGFSSGAGMAQRAAAELADKLAAVASVAGIVTPTQDTPARAVPFFYISGDADPLNPVKGGEVDLMLWGVRYQKTSHAAILDRWRDLDGCPAEEQRETTVPDVVVRLWSPCKDGSEVRYALVRGHGHHWPGEGGAGLPEGLVGPRSQALNATDAVWRFLSRFTRAP